MKKEIIGVRWHGRAGQGTVTASKMLAQILIYAGKYVQAFPEFGPERRGAPVKAYNRISDEPIYIYGPVEKPHYVLIVDPFIISSPVVMEGTEEKTCFIINTEKTPEEMKRKMNLKNNRVITVSATKIAQEVMGRDLPNMPMLSAFFSVWGEIGEERFKNFVKELLSSYFSQDIVKKNIEVVERTMEEIHGKSK